MAWEQRRNGWYFYRMTRVNGWVKRQYLGHGEDAEKAAAEIAQRKQAQNALLADRQRYAEALAPLADLSDLVDLLVKTTLFTNGFHQHKRTWRRRRDHHRQEVRLDQ
jgi:hypothetical protein